MPKPKFLVPIEVEVRAATQEEAEKEVLGLLAYGFEVSNDQGIFKSYRLHETSDTIKLG